MSDVNSIAVLINIFHYQGLSRLIIESCTGLDQIALIKKNLAPYELMTDNNEIVVSSSWAAIASPGISVKMSSNSSRLINIHFKDALGRKYVIPYKVASTWQVSTRGKYGLECLRRNTNKNNQGNGRIYTEGLSTSCGSRAANK